MYFYYTWIEKNLWKIEQVVFYLASFETYSQSHLQLLTLSQLIELFLFTGILITGYSKSSNEKQKL